MPPSRGSGTCRRSCETPAPPAGGAGARFTQSRAGSAQVQAILDGTLALSGSAEGEADLQYPVEFRVGGALYGVEPETLAFFRETAGQRMYGNVELDEMAVRVYLGLMEQQ